MKEIKEQFKFMDKIQDEWTHRREVSFFTKQIEYTNKYIILQPKCPICKKEWNSKKFIFSPFINTDREVQKWISSIMMKHFRKVHDLDKFITKEYQGDINLVGVYYCKKCKEYINGALHMIGHFIANHYEKK